MSTRHSCPGRHGTRKSPTDPTFDRQWSGVTYAPKCRVLTCPTCGGCLHHEGADSHYCPSCDDYKSGLGCRRS